MKDFGTTPIEQAEPRNIRARAERALTEPHIIGVDWPLLAKELTERVRVLEGALTRIEKWVGEFPDTGMYWDREKKQPMSYAAAYGSNGERDFMREIARMALATATPAWQPEHGPNAPKMPRK